MVNFFSSRVPVRVCSFQFPKLHPAVTHNMVVPNCLGLNEILLFVPSLFSSRTYDNIALFLLQIRIRRQKVYWWKRKLFILGNLIEFQRNNLHVKLFAYWWDQEVPGDTSFFLLPVISTPSNPRSESSGQIHRPSQLALIPGAGKQRYQSKRFNNAPFNQGNDM